MPIYLVRVKPSEPQQRLVEAKTAAQARDFALTDCVTVTKPLPGDLVALGKIGIEVEQIPADAPVAKAAE